MRTLKEKKIRNIIIILLSLVLFLNTTYASADWWNSDYSYRQQINITNTDNSNPIDANYSINVSIDTTDLYSNNKVKVNCFDLRVVYWNGTNNIELARDLENGCNSADSVIWFNAYENIAAGTSNTNYYIYYANSNANTPETLDMLIDFDEYSINSYGGSQDSNPGHYEYLDGGHTLHMWNNNWKAFTKSITIGPNTIIEVDFKSNGTTGEVNGVGLGINLDLNENYVFELFGTQNWGIQTYHNYNPSNWQHYLIDVNNQYTGSFNYLVFANDADASQATNVYYKNVKIREYMSNEPTTTTLSEVAYDTNGPNITLNSPVNNYNTTSSNLSFNFTAIDETSTVINCSLYIDSILIDTNNSVNNGTNTIINATNLEEGIHQWNIQCTDQESNLGTSTTQNFTIDITKPSVNGYTLMPDNDDDIDVNTQINFSINISDSVSIDTVIFQYKALNESTWNNDSMDFDGNNYVNASFTPNFNETWQYRTWSNDSLGNSGYSDIVNLSVQSDWTWTYYPSSFDTTSAQINENTTVGTLIINNTGDYAMRFDLSSDWQTISGDEKVYYNETEPFTLEAKQIKYLNVTVSGSNTQRSDDITITINCLNESASPDSDTSEFTLISYTAGPYLYSKINSYPSSLEQSSSGNELKAYVTNLGNETAENVYLLWSLPNGSSSEYSFNVSLGNITVGQKKWSNITFELNSDAEAGQDTISISITSSNNASSSDSKSTTISCTDGDGVCGNGCTYLTDNDCEQEVITTSSGGGGGSSSEKIAEIEELITGKELLSSSEFIEIIRGKTNSFPVKVENIYSTAELHNITLKIQGFSSRYLDIEPQTINKIEAGQTKEFTVTITSPEYLEKGTHNLKMIISGKKIAKNLNKDFIETRELELKIHIVSGETAIASIDQANLDIGEMTNAGLSTIKASQLLYQAKKSLKNKNYENTKSLCDDITKIKEEAFEAQNQINIIKQKIQDYEMSIVNEYDSITGSFVGSQDKLYETRNMLGLALAAFERGDYTTALTRLEDTEMTLSLESNDVTPVSFVLKNWSGLFASSFLFILFSFFGYKQYAKSAISEKINNLKKEEDTIRKHIKELQRKRFKERKIGPETFKRSYDHKKQRLSEIQKQRINLRHKRIRLLKPHAILNDLQNEMKDIEKSVRNLQKSYFVKAKITKDTYDEQSKIFNERIAEIEDEKMTLHVHHSM